MPDEVISADDLVRTYGDQAYHKGCQLMTECLRAQDLDSARGLAIAVRKLMMRGYHKNVMVKENDGTDRTIVAD